MFSLETPRRWELERIQAQNRALAQLRDFYNPRDIINLVTKLVDERETWRWDAEVLIKKLLIAQLIIIVQLIMIAYLLYGGYYIITALCAVFAVVVLQQTAGPLLSWLLSWRK